MIQKQSLRREQTQKNQLEIIAVFFWSLLHFMPLITKERNVGSAQLHVSPLRSCLCGLPSAFIENKRHVGCFNLLVCSG